ncbi:hypothetical protein Patl1_23805 [Pistacia atlantica]|uniref:Uncharacterized protein n=1 Tax=Pistacia atlantica TaxID=434234 RepID=A0ACC0ZWC3_9ROSI|nr:hypothetical protein Patl1_23805 [Pistacia atlantica]
MADHVSKSHIPGQDSHNSMFEDQRRGLGNLSYLNNVIEEEVRSDITISPVEKFKSLDGAIVQVTCPQKIQKVPSILRDKNNFTKHYEPRVMAIVRREIKDLRECYEKEATAPFPDDDDLAWMFFVDGCALLHYIDFAVTDKEDTTIKEFKEKGIKIDYLVYVQQDLFLLENQLPYRVLKLIMSCMSNQTPMIISIEKFVFGIIKAPRKKHEQLDHKLLEKENPIHLLDLLRTRLLRLDDKENQMSCAIVGQPIENDLQFFRNVEELKAAGIRFRPRDTGCLKDITFEFGTLRLPSIQVDDSTASKFLNLIAYEMCPDFLNDFGVSSYVVFLDMLIDQAQDVKELRDKQILHNFLGSDEEVAKLFNEIGTDLVSNPNIYRDVKSKIQRRYDNKLMTSMAQFFHEYFRSPWSAIAFLAAIIALASTVAQTVYTMLGYYK